MNAGRTVGSYCWPAALYTLVSCRHSLQKETEKQLTFPKGLKQKANNIKTFKIINTGTQPLMVRHQASLPV